MYIVIIVMIQPPFMSNCGVVYEAVIIVRRKSEKMRMFSEIVNFYHEVSVCVSKKRRS